MNGGSSWSLSDVGSAIFLFFKFPSQTSTYNTVMYKLTSCGIRKYNPESRRPDFVKCHTSTCVASLFYNTMRLLVLIRDCPLDTLSDVYIQIWFIQSSSNSDYTIFIYIRIQIVNLAALLYFCFYLTFISSFFISWLKYFDCTWWCISKLAGSSLYLEYEDFH